MGNKASRATDANVSRLKQEYLTKKLRESVPKSPIAQEQGLHFIPQKIFVDQATQTHKSSLSADTRGLQWLGLSRRSLLVAFGVYLLSCLLFTISQPLQSFMVYLHLFKWPLGDLKNLNYVRLQNARNVQFRTEDGLDLHGYHVFPQRMSYNTSRHDADLASAERIVLYLHGNGATRAYRFRTQVVRDLAVLTGAHVLSIDYRGFGDNRGWPSERGTLLDTQAVMSYIDGIVSEHGKAGKKRPRVYIYGQSLGAAIGAALAHDARIRNDSYLPLLAGLIMDAPFSSLKEAALTHPTAFLFRIFPLIQNIMLRNLKFSYPTVDFLHETQLPVLLLHGQRDGKVPIQNSQRLIARLLDRGYEEVDYSVCSIASSRRIQRTVQLKAFNAAGHNDVFRASGWAQSVQGFVDCVEGAAGENH